MLGETVEVRGWTALVSGPVVSVMARLGDSPELALQAGLRREDVAAAFPEWPGAITSGFAGVLRADDRRHGDHVLTVVAETASGQRHGWQRTVVTQDIDEAYRLWLARLDASARIVPDQAGPRIEWIVWNDTASERALADATANSWAAAGAGEWHVHVWPPLEAPSSRSGEPGNAAQYVGLIRAGDQPATGLRAALIAALASTERAPDVVYIDHDHLDGFGRRCDPVLKPGWSRWLVDHPEVAGRAWLLNATHLGLGGLVEIARRWAQVGPSFPADLLPDSPMACHVPWPLITARSHPAVAARTPAAPREIAGVSVVLPSRIGDPAMLQRCLDGLRTRTRGVECEIIVVLNNLRNRTIDEAKRLLAPWAVRILHAQGSFNWSRLNNEGAVTATRERLLFLNDDVEPISDGWLLAMLGLLERPAIGAVGAVLRYPDGQVQHAGIHVHGEQELHCRHRFRHCSGHEPRVRRWLDADRIQTAVTGACLLTTRDSFDRVGGFDVELPLVFNDVDFCLRLRQYGLFSAVAARAELLHHEGWSRAGLAEDHDRRLFCQRWAGQMPSCDEFGHPLLQPDRDDWMFDQRRTDLPVRP